MDRIAISGVLNPLSWINSPTAWQVEPDGSLVIESRPNTDWFVDPAGAIKKRDAPIALFAAPEHDFILKAKVRVDFASTFDAGVLMIYDSGTHWAKLCFEYSPQQEPMIVSVVTRGRSDDCNSAKIDGREVYLRLSRLGDAFAFHFSTGGRVWHLVRYFELGRPKALRAGFSSQSPTGRGCRATFSDIALEARTLPDIRSGE